MYQEELNYCQYNFTQLLNVKNADIICHFLAPLVCLQQGNVKKSRNLMKIVNIEGENLLNDMKHFDEIFRKYYR